jgi:hypothetical protein
VTYGVTGTAYALALDSSKNLYVGGSLTAAGDTTPVNNIALYNSTANTWSTLTDTGGNVGVGDAMSTIKALALNAGGKLYVGGSFAKAGGISANNIALWDPTARTWSVLGSGTDNGVSGSVNAMVLDSSGNLYVAGSFSTAGGKRVNSIAKWNGTTWSALGTGDYPGVNSGVLASGGAAGTISSLAFDSNGKLYVGGNFSYAGGSQVNSVAVWDGSVWCAITTPAGIVGVSGIAPNVQALVQAANGGMYLGGSFTLPGGSRFGQWVTDQDDISLSATSVAENSAAGTVVGTLATKGAAAAAYTLSGTDAGKFTISGSQLKVAANAGFDFEVQLTRNLTVTSTVGAVIKTKDFVIAVNNVNEPPTGIYLSKRTVDENSAPGTVVGQLTASDWDSRDEVIYSLVGGSDKFEISEAAPTTRPACESLWWSRAPWTMKARPP